jgi:DNA-binding CsgD family transcriptional regulator
MSDASPAASLSHLALAHRMIINLSKFSTEAAVAVELEKIVNYIGFDFHHYYSQFGIYSNAYHTDSNLPTPLSQAHSEKSGNADLIMQLAQNQLTPLIIKISDNSSRELGQAYSVLRDLQIGTAIVFPIHAKNGEAAVLGFFMHKDRPCSEEMIDLVLGEMSLAATYFHEAISRIITKVDHIPRVPLTSREIECLQLIANYKSNWVISKIFGTSEHAVVYYVRRLMWKLDAQNRYQAVERAAAYGLI